MELSELKDVNLTMKNFAVDIVKYQKFKTKIFLEKTKNNYSDYSEKTAANYFDNGVAYINTGIKRKMCSNKFYSYIDEAIAQCIQPLTPCNEDKRRIFKNTYTKKDVILPVQKVVNNLMKNKLVETFEYGVRYNDTIKVFGTDETKAKIFLAGIEFMGGKGKLVSITDLEE